MKKDGVGLAAEKAGGVSRQTKESFFGAPQTLDEFGTSPKPAVFREPAPAGTGRPGSRDFTCSGKRLSGPIPLGAHDGRCWYILGDQDGSTPGTLVRGYRRPKSD